MVSVGWAQKELIRPKERDRVWSWLCIFRDLFGPKHWTICRQSCLPMHGQYLKHLIRVFVGDGHITITIHPHQQITFFCRPGQLASLATWIRNVCIFPGKTNHFNVRFTSSSSWCDLCTIGDGSYFFFWWRWWSLPLYWWCTIGHQNELTNQPTNQTNSTIWSRRNDDEHFSGVHFH